MTPAPVLVLTGDSPVGDDLERLAVTAGVTWRRARTAAEARPWWVAAPLVILTPDVLPQIARCGLARRPGVVVVGVDLDDAGIWQAAVSVGADHVVFLPDAAPWLLTEMSEAVLGPGRGWIVSVLGGRGGAGASVLAVALAVTALRQQRRCLLVDADPLGGGIDLALGVQACPGLRWGGLAAVRGNLSPAAVREALPGVEELAVLSWDRDADPAIPPEAMVAVLGAARRGCEVTVVDLPRALTEAGRMALAESDLTLIVVPAETRACSAAARVVASVEMNCADLRVVVRGQGEADLSAPGIARALHLPLAGYLRADPRLPLAIERGEPPGARPRSALASLCGRLLDDFLGPGSPADGR